MSTVPPAIDQIAADLRSRLAAGQSLDAALDASLDVDREPSDLDAARRAQDALWASARRAAADADSEPKDPA